ncbi:hypothetical protein [Mesorhizobium sp. M0959]|uniref:hypothetical protein n=1 Tax=unclassified Mesorhizobium TaxID=325217 RepID=UPI00333DAE7C
MSEAGRYIGVKGGAPVRPSARMTAGWQSSASLRVGVYSDFEIPTSIKLDSLQGGMCVALDTPGVGLGLAPIRLDGTVLGGAALVTGLHDDDAVSQ